MVKEPVDRETWLSRKQVQVPRNLIAQAKNYGRCILKYPGIIDDWQRKKIFISGGTVAIFY